MEKQIDPRYPYTHACDLIRMSIPYGRTGGCILSRANASQIRQLFSKILKINDKELAEKLADYSLDNKEEMKEVSHKRRSELIATIKFQEEMEEWYKED